MFFSSVKETSSLISKGMLNIYLKVTTEKNWHSQNFNFLSLKNLSPGQFLRAPSHADTIEFENFLLQIKNQRSGNKSVCGFSIILVLKEIITF